MWTRGFILTQLVIYLSERKKMSYFYFIESRGTDTITLILVVILLLNIICIIAGCFHFSVPVHCCQQMTHHNITNCPIPPLLHTHPGISLSIIKHVSLILFYSALVEDWNAPTHRPKTPTLSKQRRSVCQINTINFFANSKSYTENDKGRRRQKTNRSRKGKWAILSKKKYINALKAN